MMRRCTIGPSKHRARFPRRSWLPPGWHWGDWPSGSPLGRAMAGRRSRRGRSPDAGRPERPGLARRARPAAGGRSPTAGCRSRTRTGRQRPRHSPNSPACTPTDAPPNHGCWTRSRRSSSARIVPTACSASRSAGSTASPRSGMRAGGGPRPAQGGGAESLHGAAHHGAQGDRHPVVADRADRQRKVSKPPGTGQDGPAPASMNEHVIDTGRPWLICGCAPHSCRP
jgi:cytochrome c5